MKTKFALICLILGLVGSLTACNSTLPADIPTVTPEAAAIPELPGEPSEQPPAVEDTPYPTTTPEQALIPTETLVEISVSPLPVFDAPLIRRLAMFTPLQGWALTMDGNHVLFTEDGGQTWLDATPIDLATLPPDYLTFGIRPFFLNEMTAWFTPNSADDALLYHTQNSGLDWSITTLPFDHASYFFLDDLLGYALVDLGAGAGSYYVAIYRTLDGGASWTQVFTHEPGESKSMREGGSKNGITFRGVDSGWIGGAIPMDDFFYLYYTQDGGVTWAEETDITLPAEYMGSFLDVWQPMFVSETTAYLPVHAINPAGMHLLIYRSEDYGESWAFQSGIPDGQMLDFINVNEGWAAAQTDLYRTLDGGGSWIPVAIPGIPAGRVILDVDFVDSMHGWLLVTPDDSTMDTIELYGTTDGAATWQGLN